MKRITFCQVSTRLINAESSLDLSSQYYESIYTSRDQDGYYKGQDFWEVPLWIARISKSIPGTWDKVLHVIESVDDSTKELSPRDIDYICFSVLDVNKKYIKEFIEGYSGQAQIILGGYTDLDDLRQDNVLIFDSIESFVDYLGLKFIPGTDYSLFKGFKTIPRITLSKGCLFHCKFCTVSDDLELIPDSTILDDAKSFHPLKFKLVYLDDKTFFQAKNYRILKQVYQIIKSYNPDFNGFVIQTTCSTVLKHLSEIKELNIFAIELGIETYNNTLLKALNKPQDERLILKAMEALAKLDVKVIPNIIIGVIGEDKASYDKTLSLLGRFKEYIYILNIYNLAIYNKAQLSKEIDVNSDNDLNENSLDKSFYNSKQRKDNAYFYNSIFSVGLKILSQVLLT